MCVIPCLLPIMQFIGVSEMTKTLGISKRKKQKRKKIKYPLIASWIEELILPSFDNGVVRGEMVC